MNKLVICLAFTFVVIIKAQEQVIYAEMFNQMMKNKELLKRTSSEKMSDITDRKGFEYFVMSITRDEKYVKDLMKEIDVMMNDDYMKHFSQEFKDDTIKFFKEINDNIILTHGKRRMKFDLHFTNEKGLMEMFKYSVTELEDNNGYFIDKTIIISDFTPSKPYTIVSYSYSNMVRDEYSEDIRYLPNVFTMEHLDFILKVSGSLLSFFEKGTFEPLLTDKYYERKETNEGKRIKYRNHYRDEHDDTFRKQRMDQEDDDNDEEQYENRYNDRNKKHRYSNDEHNFFKNENNFMKFDV